MTTYTFVPSCDAFVGLLTERVPVLAAATVHRYVPWDTLTADDAQLHLAVYPGGETYGMERGSYTDVPIGSLDVVQSYTLLIWQATEEGERVAADEDAAAEMLNAVDEMREIFADGAPVAGVVSVRWVGVRIGRTGRVRFAKVELQVSTFVGNDC